MSSNRRKRPDGGESAGTRSDAQPNARLIHGKMPTVAELLAETGNYLSHSTIPSSASSYWNSLSTIAKTPEINFDSWSLITTQKEEELSSQIQDLRRQISKQADEVREERRRSGKAEKELSALHSTVEALQRKERLAFVHNRISQDAGELLLDSTSFQDAFLAHPTCHAFVMSVDIRRSTELMLKARRPELFAQFVTELCGSLRDIVLGNHGVFDKFTGDGILAFFPEFYSGPDAGFHAVLAADQCHIAFRRHYDKSRHCFNSVLSDVGLGIGLDAGETHLVQLGDGLTVVGTPVVYACRMGAGPAGRTLLNQPAYEAVFERFSGHCTFRETTLETKHEGSQIAYEVELNGKPYLTAAPGWFGFKSVDDSQPSTGME